MTTSGAPPEASEAVTIYDWKDLGSVEDSVPAVARRCLVSDGSGRSQPLGRTHARSVAACAALGPDARVSAPAPRRAPSARRLGRGGAARDRRSEEGLWDAERGRGCEDFPRIVRGAGMGGE